MIRSCYIVGSGNMAYFLSDAFRRVGIPIAGIYARNSASGTLLAKEFQAEWIPDLRQIPDEADTALFLCVPDQSIETVAEHLSQRTKQLLLHTSGNTPLSVLSAYAAAYGCFWPLASVSKRERTMLTDIPICIEGSDDSVTTSLHVLAGTLSGKVCPMNGSQRSLMHLSAVLTQNFANHLFALADQLCAQHGLDAKLLQPMMHEWTKRLATNNAQDMQTGPARRHDENTLAGHRALLSEHPELLEVYNTLTASIRKMYG